LAGDFAPGDLNFLFGDFGRARLNLSPQAGKVGRIVARLAHFDRDDLTQRPSAPQRAQVNAARHPHCNQPRANGRQRVVGPVRFKSGAVDGLAVDFDNVGRVVLAKNLVFCGLVHVVGSLSINRFVLVIGW
jgi:hypothetical protein